MLYSIILRLMKYYNLIPMHETTAIVKALKIALKRKQLHYRDVAKHLNLSEAQIKRLFSQNDLSLIRLEQILGLMDMRMVDLFEMLQWQESYISELTPHQEDSLIQQPKLLMTFFLLLNRWKLEEIYNTFSFEHLEMIQLLAKLDKLKLIELQPNNKVKLLTANNFSWRKNGPVQKFFEEMVLSEFFKHKFNTPDAKLQFLGGMLSESSLEKLKILIDDFSNRVNEMLRQDIKLPLDKKYGMGIVLAARKWELSIFTKMRRQ